jgi:hypothetical protein
VALVPLLLAAGLALAQMLAAGLAAHAAGQAAQAGAMAVVQDTGDPVEAARAAAPGWSRRRLQVRPDGRRVTVTVRPPGLLPGMAGPLTARRTADAGPEGTP